MQDFSSAQASTGPYIHFPNLCSFRVILIDAWFRCHIRVTQKNLLLYSWYRSRYLNGSWLSLFSLCEQYGSNYHSQSLLKFFYTSLDILRSQLANCIPFIIESGDVVMLTLSHSKGSHLIFSMVPLNIGSGTQYSMRDPSRKAKINYSANNLFTLIRKQGKMVKF